MGEYAHDNVRFSTGRRYQAVFIWTAGISGGVCTEFCGDQNMNMDMIIMILLIAFIAGGLIYLVYNLNKPELYSVVISSDVLDMQDLLRVIHEHGFRLYEIRRHGDFSDQEASGLRRLTFECPRGEEKKAHLLSALAHLPGINSISEV